MELVIRVVLRYSGASASRSARDANTHGPRKRITAINTTRASAIKQHIRSRRERNTTSSTSLSATTPSPSALSQQGTASQIDWHPPVLSPSLPTKHEEATRQQGGLFFRENSSNGGKAIRTFWRNTKFGPNRCQGLNLLFITHYVVVSYGGVVPYTLPLHILLIFAFAVPVKSQNGIK
jgi:hypothetical protein